MKPRVSLAEEADREFFSRLTFPIVFLAIWNALFLIYTLVVTFAFKDRVQFPSAYGDYLRSDLFFVLVQNNFQNPYEFHNEIPWIRNQPYLPLPYLLLRLIPFEIRFFSQNLFWVHLIVGIFMLILSIMILWSLKRVSNRRLVLGVLGVFMFSPGTMYLFTTGNIQIFILFATIFIYGNYRSDKKWKIALFLNIVLITATKPQFLFISFKKAISTPRESRFFLASIGCGILISLSGFYVFGDDMISNIKYWLASLGGFINSTPEYIVHNNASLIGNLSAIEMLLFPERAQSLYSIKFAVWIAVTFFIIFLHSYYRIYEKKGTAWVQLSILVSIVTILIPVSYNYNLTLFLVPMLMLISSHVEREAFVKIVLSSKSNLAFFYLFIFLVFATKPLHVWLIEGRADTNLFNMMNALCVFPLLALSHQYAKKVSIQ